MKMFFPTSIISGIFEIEKSCILFLMILLIVFVMKLLLLRSVWSLLSLMIILKVNFRSDMCVNGRFVTNKYTGNVFWCTCGKCPACIQQKAAVRSARIRNEYSPDWLLYFIELDYDRLSCPYFIQRDFDNLFVEPKSLDIDKDDLYGANLAVPVLPIYRYHNVRWDVRTQSYKHSFHPKLLYNHVLKDLDFRYDDKYRYCRWLNKQPGKIGVPYFKDVQDFEKRLRQWLKRKLHYEEKIKVFNVNELGEKSQRPHFHLLLFVRGLTESQVREAVCQTWPFSDRARYEKKRVLEGKKPKVVQLVQDDPAGYVSSYVNSLTSVSPFLARYFDVCKHSASKFFGHGRRSFSLEKIQEKVSAGDLSFDVERTRNGVREVVNIPIPKYVINRYFPLFKGYSRFTDPQIREFLSNGFDVGYLLRESLKYDSRTVFKIDYSLDKYVNLSEDPNVVKFGLVRGDLSKIRTRLLHAYEFFKTVFPNATYDTYSRSYVSAWNCYKSNSYKRFVTDTEVSDFYKYDNIALLPRSRQIELHGVLDPYCRFIVDNNKKPQYVNLTHRMTEMYFKYDKQRKVSDTVREINDCVT